MLFLSLLLGTFRRHFYKFCQLLKFVCMISFNLRIIDAFSYRKLSHNLFFSTLCQMANSMTSVSSLSWYIFWLKGDGQTSRGVSLLSWQPADFEKAAYYTAGFTLVAHVQTFKCWWIFFGFFFFQKTRRTCFVSKTHSFECITCFIW